MNTSKQRKFPPSGTVVCIPLRGGGYAYAVAMPTSTVWVFDYITQIPAFDIGLCSPAHWFQYISCLNGAVGAETFDVGRIDLSDEQTRCPKYWQRANEYQISQGWPTPYIGTDPENELCDQDYPITEAELPQYQEYMILTSKQLQDYLEANRHRFRIVEVDESKVVSPPAVSHESVDPVSVFDVWLSGLEHMKVTDPEEISEEIDAELEKYSAGEVIGTGQTDGQDQHNIAVQNAPGKNKQALACIRRVLKRLKADPETTDIWEQKADAQDHIKHAL